MYKLIKDTMSGTVTTVQRLSDTAFIPFDPDNTDYQTFRKEVLAGAELLDADGNVMTDASAYIATLP
jgi:hypothetical protein